MIEKIEKGKRESQTLTPENTKYIDPKHQIHRVRRRRSGLVGRRRHCWGGGCGLESDRERAVMDEEERDGGNKDKVSEEVRRRESGGWVPEERARSSRLDILYVLVFL